MMEEDSWIWIEKLFKKIPVPYPIVSIIAGGIICLIYMFFTTKVVFFPLDGHNILAIAILSFLIAFQLAGIQNILNNMKKTFGNLESIHKNDVRFDELYDELKDRFCSSYRYYLLVAAVTVPFIIIDILDILSGGVTFYIVEPTVWSFLLDIYSTVMGYLMLYLLAIILWIIFNIALMIYKIGKDPYRRTIKIDIHHVDKIVGLKPLSDLIFKTDAFYFMCIIIQTILLYTPLFIILCYESYLLILLLIVGVGFFIMRSRTISKILKDRKEDEINKINERYQRHHQRLMDIVENYKDKAEELNMEFNLCEIYYKEGERKLQLYSNFRKRYFGSIIKIASLVSLSLLVSIISDILKGVFSSL